MAMKDLLSRSNDVRIKKKLMISYFVSVFVPIILVGIFLTNALRQMAIEQAIQQAVNNVEKIGRRTEEILRVPSDISNKIYIDKSLRMLVQNRYKTTLDVVNAYQASSDLTEYIRLYKELSGVRFYTDNSTMLNNGTFLQLNDNTMRKQWFQEGLHDKGKISWAYIPDETRGDRMYLSLIREILSDNRMFGGMLVVSVNPQFLNDAVSQEPFNTMIVTEKGYIVASKDTTLVGKTLSELKLDKTFSDLPEGIAGDSYLGKASKVIIHRLQPENSRSSLRVISVFPVETIVREAQKTSKLGIGIILGSLVLSWVLILFFSGALTRRIAILSRDIRRVARGDLSRTTTIGGKDEIGELARHFNFMVNSIHDLMLEVSKAKDQKNALLLKQKEIKLRLLANQINPHFLFNVLETIRMKALLNDENEIANAVKSLGKLIRKNLELGQDPVPLKEELELVRSYLDIQKFRFGAKIDFILPEPEEVHGLLILPLSLQPLVENAIIHGLENKEGPGTIIVSLPIENNRVVLAVTDNGIGMAESSCVRLMESMEEPDEGPGTRIGLRNVHQRIKLHYGAEYGLRITSLAGEGTRVEIVYPRGG